MEKFPKTTPIFTRVPMEKIEEGKEGKFQCLSHFITTLRGCDHFILTETDLIFHSHFASIYYFWEIYISLQGHVQ